jgi:hypothetical protein
MEELLELKNLLISGNIADALLLVEEMTEMSKDDKLNKIISFGIILLLHLIKQQAEKRTTRSWEISICDILEYRINIALPPTSQKAIPLVNFANR